MIRKNNRLWNRLKLPKIRMLLQWLDLLETFSIRYRVLQEIFLEIINRQLKEQLLDLP
jgi:hypothetical protein